MLNTICCDKCLKSSTVKQEYNINYTCSYCGFKETYYYINCNYYSFFISKSKFNLYNIKSVNLDKKQEYKYKCFNYLYKIKKVKNNLEYKIYKLPPVSTYSVLDNEDLSFTFSIKMKIKKQIFNLLRLITLNSF